MIILWQAFRVILIFLIVNVANAGTYYVSTDGKTTNDGTTSLPWPSVEYALSIVGGGNTILLKAGSYGPINIDVGYNGTEASPTIIKSEIKWKAKINSSLIADGVSTAAGCDWVIIDGFEIFGARRDGIKVGGSNSTVINCWVHSNAQQGISMQNCKNGTIENNLVEFNGSNIEFHHGIYAGGDGLIIKSNIVRNNAGAGMYLYPSIKNSHIEKNVVHNSKYNSAIFLACPVGGGHNIIANNTISNSNIGLTLLDGDDEVVANNIFNGSTTANTLLTGGTKATINTVALNNMVSVSTYLGITGDTGTVTADPKFLDVLKSIYWLDTGSPAVGAGNATYLPAADFWGNAYSGTPYIGAFAYKAELTPLAYRTTTLSWYYGWGYGYAPGAVQPFPDFWIF